MTGQSEPLKFLELIIDCGYQLRVMGHDPITSKVVQPSDVMRLLTDYGRAYVDILALPDNFTSSVEL